MMDVGEVGCDLPGGEDVISVLAVGEVVRGKVCSVHHQHSTSFLARDLDKRTQR